MSTAPNHAAHQEREARLKALLDETTLEGQVAPLAAADFWPTVPTQRLGVPAIKVADGPNGARRAVRDRGR